jgi:hypothetical protein
MPQPPRQWTRTIIFKAQPAFHVDIGSHHKFVGLLSKVVKTTMVDLRPLPVMLDSLEFNEGSILALPFQDARLAIRFQPLCGGAHRPTPLRRPS